MMRSQVVRSITAGFILALAGMPTPPACAITATVQTADGSQRVTLADHPFEFQTSVGRVRLAADVLQSLRYDAALDAQVATSRYGERWVIVPSRRPAPLPLLESDTGRPLALDARTVQALHLPTRPSLHAATHHAVLELDDSTRLLIPPAAWTLELSDEDATCHLPVGAIASLTQTTTPPPLAASRPPDAATTRGYPRQPMNADPSALTTWILEIPGCRPCRWVGTLGRRAWNLEDLHGNTLRIPPARLRRLEGRHGLPLLPDMHPSSAPVLASRQVHTALGPLLLPDALLTSGARTGDGHVLHTLFGDRLTVLDHEADAPPAAPTVDAEPASAQVATPTNLPAGWLQVHLPGGDHVIARFAETSLAWRISGDAQPTFIATDEIRALRRLGDSLAIETHGNRLWYGAPTAPGVDLLLLFNGMPHTLTWAALRQSPAGAETSVPEGMRALAGGLFLMGRNRGEGLPDELPPHAVTLSAFYLDIHEVTRAQFAEFIDATQYRTDAERAGLTATWRLPGFPQQADEPVVGVTWHDAVRYCNWRSARERLTPCYTIDKQNQVTTVWPPPNGYRLPTEAEWEFAARQGGKDRLYPWGDDDAGPAMATRANFRQPPGAPADPWLWTNPVLAFPPDELGLYGMAGNVWEWCEDWYFAQAYGSIHRQRPQDPCVLTRDLAGLTHRVMRGGSFDNAAELLRNASRGHGLPTASANRVGFRCARSAHLPPPR